MYRKNLYIKPLLLYISVLLISACNTEEPAAPAAPPKQKVVATVIQPSEKQVTDKKEFLGRFQAIEAVDIRSRVTGYLRDIRFKDGDIVKKGDVLFVIDQRPFKIALDQERANLSAAKAQYDLTQKELKRTRRLLKSKAISQEEYDKRDQERRVAQARVNAAEQTVRRAQLDLEFTKIKSPITGKVGRYQISEGNLIKAEDDKLTKVVSVHPMHFYFELSETDFINYKKYRAEHDKQKEVTNNISIKQLDNAKTPFVGYIDFLNNEVNRSTGTIEARAVIDNKAGVLESGMFGRATLEMSDPYSALLLPETLITTDQSRKVVIVAEEGKAVAKPVVLGQLEENLVVIKSGLKKDDQVIAHALHKFRAGTAIDEVVAENASDAQ